MIRPRSYDFDRFADARKRGELLRLQAQAGFMLAQELQALREQGLRSSHRFLEVGCGPGFVTGAVAQTLTEGQALGVDISTDLLAAARALVQPEHANISFQQGEATALPFADHSFDFVYSRLLYQHLADPLAALVEARRVTRPGGRICILDIDDGWLSLHPASPAFSEFNARVIQAKAAQGGDRLVGRKLASTMLRAGLSDVMQRVETLSSLQLGIEPFLDLTTRFKAGLLPPEQAGPLLEQLNRDLAAAEQPAVGNAAIFFAAGTAWEPPC